MSAKICISYFLLDFLIHPPCLLHHSEEYGFYNKNCTVLMWYNTAMEVTVTVRQVLLLGTSFTREVDRKFGMSGRWSDYTNTGFWCKLPGYQLQGRFFFYFLFLVPEPQTLVFHCKFYTKKMCLFFCYRLIIISAIQLTRSIKILWNQNIIILHHTSPYPKFNTGHYIFNSFLS